MRKRSFNVEDVYFNIIPLSEKTEDGRGKALWEIIVDGEIVAYGESVASDFNTSDIKKKPLNEVQVAVLQGHMRLATIAEDMELLDKRIIKWLNDETGNNTNKKWESAGEKRKKG